MGNNAQNQAFAELVPNTDRDVNINPLVLFVSLGSVFRFEVCDRSYRICQHCDEALARDLKAGESSSVGRAWRDGNVCMRYLCLDI